MLLIFVLNLLNRAGGGVGRVGGRVGGRAGGGAGDRQKKPVRSELYKNLSYRPSGIGVKR